MDKRTREKIRVETRRFNRAQHLFDQMAKKRYTKEFSRVVFTFTAAELGIEKPVLLEKGKKWPRDYSQQVSYSLPKVDKQTREEYKAHYASHRQQALEERKSNLTTPIVVPDVYDPEGVSTIDLDNITTAQVDIDEENSI